MQQYELSKDVRVLCIPAKSFPGGIKDAFDKLNRLLPDAGERLIFGLSKPQNGVIRYRAAANEKFKGEATQLGCTAFTIKKGVYLGETLMDWQKNEMMIMSIFNRLIADKRLDGSSHCIEWYKNDTELLCMVLIRNEEVNGEITKLTI